jgi:hypothetical protein
MIGAIVVGSSSDEHGTPQVGINQLFQSGICISFNNSKVLAMNWKASKQDTRNGQQGPVARRKHGESQLDQWTMPKGKDAVGTKRRSNCKVCI